MLLKWNDVLFALLLGIVLPALIVSFMRQDNYATKPESPQMNIENKDLLAEETIITVLMKDGSLQEMQMGDYLTCVLLREMPANFQEEALKAQAVVARTYVLRRCRLGSKHEEADVCAISSCCQGFYAIDAYLADGGKQSSVDKIRDAVVATKNEVLVYNGKLIDATYFSCSGGMTEDAVAVWGDDIPYLRATTSPGEESAKHYIDTVTISTEEFFAALGIESLDDDRIIVDNVQYTAGGGIDTVEICGVEFKGTTLRKKLKLRSTSALMSVVGDSVTITTKGYGHRVGMSQYGANAMASAGANYKDILTHYYWGVSIITDTLD